MSLLEHFIVTWKGMIIDTILDKATFIEAKKTLTTDVEFATNYLHFTNEIGL